MRILPIFMLLTLIAGAATASPGAGTYTLQDAYDSALSSNEAVKISEENVVQADSRVDQAWTYLYPRVTANGAYTHYNDVLPPGGGAFIFQPLNQVQASLVLTQPLYTGGRTLAALRAAKTMQVSSRKDHASEQQTILLSVAEAYYAVLEAQRIVDVSRDSLARMERHKQVTEREARTRRTKANVSALLRANTLVSQADITLVRARDGLAIARKKLSLLTRLPESAELVEPEKLPPVEEPLESLQEQALRNRNDYAGSRLREKIAEEYVTVTKGAHYPQLYAEGGVQYVDSSPATGMDATTYYGGLRLQVPIFEGGLMNAQVAEARSRQRQAEYGAELLKRSIETEVQEAYISCRSSAAVLETARVQLDYARSNFDTVEGLFTEGLVASLSLIDAQQALFLAERELVTATYDQQLSILRLRRSMGLLGKGS